MLSCCLKQGLGRGCSHQDRLGAELLQRSSAGKDLGVLVDSRLTMSQQCALVAQKANGTLSCTAQSVVTRAGRWFCPLLCTGRGGTAAALCPVWGSPVAGRLGTAGESPAEGAEMVGAWNTS